MNNMLHDKHTLLHILWAFILIQVVALEKTIVSRQSGTQPSALDDDSENIMDLTEDENRRIARILLDGDASEIGNVNITELVQTLHYMSGTNVNLKCLPEIWKILKENIGLQNITISTLEQWRTYFRYISEKDFFELSEREDIENSFIRVFEDLNKRNAVIFMSSLLERHEKNYFLNHTNLNNLYSMLCGMPRTILFRIPPEEFAQISGEVFKKLNSCSLARLRRLLLLMMRSTVHGPTQSWNEIVVEKLNLLLLALEIDELRAIHPGAMQHISPSVIELMNIELIQTISKEQISKFNFPAFLAYRRRFYFTNNQMYHNKISFNYYVLLWIILVAVY